METTDISDRDAINDVINNNHDNETINVLHDDVNAVDDDVDTGVTGAGDVADVVVDGTVANTAVDVGSADLAVGSTDIAVGSTDITVGSTDITVGSTDLAVGSTDIAAVEVDSSDTVPGNSNSNTIEDSSDIFAETTIEKIDTTATTSNDYDNEVIIDSDNDQPPVVEAVEDITNVEDDSKDKDDKDSDNEHQSSMFNPILRSSTTSDHAFSPSNSATQQLSSSSSKDNYSDRKSGAKLDAIDLCYSVIINGKLKKILKNINFSLEPGCMCALLGSSTAGKR